MCFNWVLLAVSLFGVVIIFNCLTYGFISLIMFSFFILVCHCCLVRSVYVIHMIPLNLCCNSNQTIRMRVFSNNCYNCNDFNVMIMHEG